MSALPRRGDPLRALARPGGLAVLAITAFAALLSVQAADGPWLGELGRAIASRGGIPDGVPYASAPSAGWPNVPALGELVFALLGAFGSRGVQVAQVAAVCAAMALLARDARRAGAQERALALALLLLLPACFGPLVAIRAELFSLPLFAACALLLRAEARVPSRRIWLLVPLLALWGNLHGAVLTGAAVAGAYLVFERSRRRPGESAAVAIAGVLALCANPALWDTPSYVLGVLHNEAARQSFGLWAPLGLESGLDLAFIVAGLALVAGALRSRPRPWELVALAGLAVLTLHAARGGVWLALFAVPLAAAGFGGPARGARLHRLARPLAFALIVIAIVGIAHGPLASGAGPRMLHRTLALAHGTPVLAEDVLAEQVATEGGRVWMANPIDAFSTRDQRVYVEWMRGCRPGTAHSRTLRAPCSCAWAARPTGVCVRMRHSAASPPTIAPCSTRASRADGRGLALVSVHPHAPRAPADAASTALRRVVPGLDLDAARARVGEHVQRQRAQMVVVDEQLERVVAGMLEAHAVHLQDQRRGADRHAGERRVAGRELALQRRHHVPPSSSTRCSFSGARRPPWGAPRGARRAPSSDR